MLNISNCILLLTKTFELTLLTRDIHILLQTTQKECRFKLEFEPYRSSLKIYIWKIVFLCFLLFILSILAKIKKIPPTTKNEDYCSKIHIRNQDKYRKADKDRKKCAFLNLSYITWQIWLLRKRTKEKVVLTKKKPYFCKE